MRRAVKRCLIFKQRHTPAVLVVVGHSNVSDLSCSILARTAPLSIDMHPLTNMLHRNITLTSKVPYLMRAKVVSLRGTCTTATSSLLGVPSRPQAPCARTFKRMRPFSTTSSQSSGGKETSPPAVPETPLYSSHIPTSGFQKLYIAGFSAATAFRDPERGDMVAALGETTGTRALQRLRRAMSADPVGRELLAAKPDIKEDSTRPDRLRRLPEGTFGREYARFLDHHGYSPDERAAVRFVDDAELAFVMQRYRQVHDFWHVLCGLPPTVLGELALKWFEMVQTRLPIAAFSGVVGPLSLSAQERKLLKEQYIPWAVRAAVKARPLMCVWYERSFEEPLELMRKRLQIVTAPPMTAV